MANDGEKWKQWQNLFPWASKPLWSVTTALKLKDSPPSKKSYDKSRQCTKKKRHHFANKGPYSQSYSFSSSPVWIWELDHKEGWVLWRIDAFKLWCWSRLRKVPWTTRKSNQSILREINIEDEPLREMNLDQPSTLNSLEGLMLKLKAPIFWWLDVKSQLIGKDLEAVKDWR